jgi:hypothetical protein
MPIQRQYSLPNCVLILEGLSNSPEASATGNRPELSIVTRFECYFAREKQTLVGGRDLLEGLLKATNNCVQSWISGLQPTLHKGAAMTQQVQLHPASTGGFDLAIPGELLAQGTVDESKPIDQPLTQPLVQLHISSVQLFDLMEAIDQLAADQKTLPDLQTEIRPRSRQEVRSSFATLEQAAPIAIGTASVAVAAAALFFMPVPKAPEPPKDTQTAPATLGQPVVAPSIQPPGVSPEKTLKVTPGSASPSPTGLATPSSSTPPQTSGAPSSPAMTPDAVPESNNASPPASP